MSDDFIDFVQKALISGTSCAVISAILNPFDVTKIRLQNQPSGFIKYKGMMSGARVILLEEGVAGLSKGMTPSMLRELSYSSVRFGAYEPIRETVGAFIDGPSVKPQDASPIVKFFSALISGGVGAAICNPFDLIKTRFQAQLPGESSPYKNTFHAIATIYKDGGVSSLYKGWVVTSGRAAVLTSAQLGSYDTIKNNILIKYFGLSDGIFLHFSSSMIAGVITTTAANPLDVIKTRYMSDHMKRFSSPVHCVAVTFKEDGIRGFFKGWAPAYWRLGPHTVLSLMLIERVRRYFGLNTM